MCFYEVKVFEDCPCTAFGAFRKACSRSGATGEPCGQRTFGRLLRQPGKCERCRESNGIAQQPVEKNEHSLAETLADDSRPALEGVSSVFLSVYEAIRVKRRLRSKALAKSLKGGTELPGIQEPGLRASQAEAQSFSRDDFPLYSAVEDTSALAETMDIDFDQLLNTNGSLLHSEDQDLFHQWLPQDHPPPTASDARHKYQNETQFQYPVHTQGLEDLQSMVAPDMHVVGVDFSAPQGNQDMTQAAANQQMITDLQICKTNSRGFRNGLEMHDETKRPKTGESANFSGLHLSRIRLYQTNEKFRSAATKAYNKLKRAAWSDAVSDDFRRFYRDLGDLEDIFKAGFDTLESFLGGGIPRSLKEMYSFLHVAYAMSQAELQTAPVLKDSEFAAGISIFKSCLPNEPTAGGQLSEQDLFDEIVKIMWDELHDAMVWAKENLGNLPVFADSSASDRQEVYDILKWSYDQNAENQEAAAVEDPTVGFNAMVSEATSMEFDPFRVIPNQSPSVVPKWDDLFTSRGFSHVVQFLKSLTEVGTVFLYLCGTFYSVLRTATATTPHFRKDLDPEKRKPPATQSVIDPKELELQDHMLEYVINPLRHDNAGSKIAKVAKYMLRAVPMNDLLDFESYLIGLIKVCHRPKQEFTRLVLLVLSLCRGCYHSLSGQCKSTDQLQPLYTDEYLMVKARQEESWYCSEEENESNRLSTSLATTDSPSQLDIFNLNLANDGFDITSDSFKYYSDQEYTSPSAFSASSHCSAYSMPLPSRKRVSGTAKKTGVPQIKKRRIDPDKKPYACEFPGCRHRDTTESNLKRHHAAEHGGENVKNMVYRCDFEGCSAQRTGARALENIKTHKKEKHGIGGRKGKSTLIEV
ncbi:hypothetical protein ABW21_db0209667 [Orbilia brochopaga]|nr:hypothetical protein ABW21_db0209667 [Drechslerella brochopaga]